MLLSPPRVRKLELPLAAEPEPPEELSGPPPEPPLLPLWPPASLPEPWASVVVVVVVPAAVESEESPPPHAAKPSARRAASANTSSSFRTPLIATAILCRNRRLLYSHGCGF